MIRLLSYPDPKLRRRAEPLPSAAFGTPGITRYAQALAGLMVARGADGLPASDVLATPHADLGVDLCWRSLALRQKGGVVVIFNPEIVSHGADWVEFEASYPFACVPERLGAPKKLVLRYRTVEGLEREVECDATGARAVWQGVSGLNGHLVIDRMTQDQALRFVRRYQKKLVDERENLVNAAGSSLPA